MKIKCSCIDRKILKSERQDYPKGTERIIVAFCNKHQKEFDEEAKLNIRCIKCGKEAIKEEPHIYRFDCNHVPKNWRLSVG